MAWAAIMRSSRMLDVALNLFAQHGYAGTSMLMLARATGLRERSFYNHFAGKDELYQAVLAQWGPMEFVERLTSAEYRALSDDPPAFFRLCGKHLVARWIDPRERLFMAMISIEGPGGPGEKRYTDAPSERRSSCWRRIASASARLMG